MRLETWPWARANLTAEDRVEIAQAVPLSAKCHIGLDGASGVFRATITGAMTMQTFRGYGRTPIAAFRAAMAGATE